MPPYTPDILIRSENILGECPIWHPEERALYWVDVHGKLLQRYDWRSGATEKYELEEFVGSFAFCAGVARRVLLALAPGFYLYDLEERTGEWLACPNAGQPHLRFNEGKCDRRGRFWAGTMADAQPRAAEGKLYRLNPNGQVTAIFGDIFCPNCLVWSADDSHLYFADTPRQQILRYPFEPEAGQVGVAELFVDTRGHPGLPDGGALDVDGCLWNAEWGGGRLVRYTPEGRIDRVLPLPTTQTTSCAFAGDNLDTLVITTATRLLDEGELRAQAGLAGQIYAVHVGTSGYPEPFFGA